MNIKKECLIFAPLPPPMGGIASISQMLHKGLDGEKNVLFEQPIGKGTSNGLNLIRSFQNLIKLLISLRKVKKNGRVLFFSSAYFSFWEKLLWTKLSLLFHKQPVLVMVDGNFPRYFQSLSKNKKKFAVWAITNDKTFLAVQSSSWQFYYKGIFPNSKIHIISASVDEIFFKNSLRNIEKKDIINVLYLGWIIEDKGILDLLDAVMLIKGDLTNTKFNLFGSMFGKDEFWNDELYKREICHLVNFGGVLNSKEVILSTFLNSDIFVFPSHFEGFPVALLESAAMGLPCIATNVGGIPDILENGEIGIIVEPKSPRELANALLKLIKSEELRISYSIKASTRIREQYNCTNFINSYKTILNLNE